MPLIPLAYLAVPGEEHYDGIISIRDSTLFHSVIDKTCLIRYKFQQGQEQNTTTQDPKKQTKSVEDRHTDDQVNVTDKKQTADSLETSVQLDHDYLSTEQTTDQGDLRSNDAQLDHDDVLSETNNEATEQDDLTINDEQLDQDLDDISNNKTTGQREVENLHENENKKCSEPSDLTPHKRAKYQSPKKKKKRKKKAEPEMWKRNVKKRLKLSGQEYVSRTNKIVAEKTVKEIDCSKCRFQCNDKIPDNVRQEIFDSYYIVWVPMTDKWISLLQWLKV